MNGCDRGDSEDGGGGFDHAFCLPKNCGYMYVEFENLEFVHSWNKKRPPGVGRSISMGMSMHWSGHRPRQKELQRWDSAVNIPVIFFHGNFEAILWICIMALGKTLRKHVELVAVMFH